MTSEVTEGLSGIRMARTYRLEEPLAENADGVFERLFGLAHPPEPLAGAGGADDGGADRHRGGDPALRRRPAHPRRHHHHRRLHRPPDRPRGRSPARRGGSAATSPRCSRARRRSTASSCSSTPRTPSSTARSGSSARSGRSASRTCTSPIPTATWRSTASTSTDRAGAARRLRRPLRGGQVHGLQPAAAALRPDRRGGSCSTATTSAR